MMGATRWEGWSVAEPEKTDNKYGNWFEAAKGGNLASYALANLPGRLDLVPGAKPDDNTLTKVLDYASLPARLLTNELLSPIKLGGDAMDRWMKGDQGPEVQRQIAAAVGGMALNGLAVSNPLRVRPNELLAIPGYHGTPHTFSPEPGAPLGSFRNDKIGSGEGAQAYGWGHYVAEREGVARAYQEQLSNTTPIIKNNAVDVMPAYVENLLKSMHADVPTGVSPTPARTIDEVKRFLREDIDWMSGKITNYEGQQFYNESLFVIKDGKPVYDPRLMTPHDVAKLERAKTSLAWLEANGDKLDIQPASPGNLYHVEIAPDKHQLLDWDRPLAEMSPEVQKLLRERVGPTIGFHDIDPRVTGKDIYLSATRFLGDTKKASELLHESGIPGLQFMDQLSRRTGKIEPPTVTKLPKDQWGRELWHAVPYPAHPYSGKYFLTKAEADAFVAEHAPRITHNFVIFHPQNLRITGANGKPLDYTPVNHDPFAGPSAPQGGKP